MFKKTKQQKRRTLQLVTVNNYTVLLIFGYK